MAKLKESLQKKIFHTLESNGFKSYNFNFEFGDPDKNKKFIFIEFRLKREIYLTVEKLKIGTATPFEVIYSPGELEDTKKIRYIYSQFNFIFEEIKEWCSEIKKELDSESIVYPDVIKTTKNIDNKKKVNDFEYENLLKFLIKEGEKENIDFKEILNLKTKKNKSEFVKDISSIANSTLKIGYLIIGVSDNKEIFGTEPISEEQIQTICYRYIQPKINIECKEINYKNKNIALIKIMPNRKPFEISKDIDKIKQHDVFVRYGTTTQKASLSDIIEMNEWSNPKGIKLSKSEW